MGSTVSTVTMPTASSSISPVPPSNPTLSTSTSSCFWCFSSTAKQCDHCHLVAVCDDHWRLHRTEEEGTGSVCFPIRVEEHPVLGRRLLAVRPIPMGSIVLTDLPSCLGPTHSSLPLCLECSKLLPCPSFACPYCGYPLCGKPCMGGPRHQAECEVINQAGKKVKISRGDREAVEYQVIMLLRLLLSGKEELDRVDLLSHHVDKLTQVEREVYGAGVVKVIREGLKLGNWTEEELFRYISIIRTNACVVDPGAGTGSLRVLHPSLSTMNHSCLVNTRVFQRSDHSVCVRAQVDIATGEEIFNRYTSLFQGRLDRQSSLTSAWHFSCLCPRCSDPTDLGSHADSLHCPVSSCPGLLLPSLNSESLVQHWECEVCSLRKECGEVKDMEARLGEAIQSRAGNISALEILLKDQADTFHSNHHLLLNLKVQIILEYGRLMDSLAKEGKSWSLKQVRRKVELCRQVLAALDLIEK